MANQNNFSENLEDYLEIILDLQRTNKVARSKDIAERMGIQRGSVTSMLKNLSTKGLIDYEPYGYVTLTDQGETIAEEIERRHGIIKDFLSRVLMVDDEKADGIACRMEHVVDRQTIDKLVNFIHFLDTCPKMGKDWLQAYVTFCNDGKPDKKTCDACMGKTPSAEK